VVAGDLAVIVPSVMAVRVRGTVTNHGSPVVGARLMFISEVPDTRGEAVTNSDGYYEAALPASGGAEIFLSYRGGASFSRQVNLGPGLNTIDLPLQAGAITVSLDEVSEADTLVVIEASEIWKTWRASIPLGQRQVQVGGLPYGTFGVWAWSGASASDAHATVELSSTSPAADVSVRMGRRNATLGVDVDGGTTADRQVRHADCNPQPPHPQLRRISGIYAPTG
jgi:hypothetical protein